MQHDGHLHTIKSTPNTTALFRLLVIAPDPLTLLPGCLCSSRWMEPLDIDNPSALSIVNNTKRQLSQATDTLYPDRVLYIPTGCRTSEVFRAKQVYIAMQVPMSRLQAIRHRFSTTSRGVTVTTPSLSTKKPQRTTFEHATFPKP
jgi:hypothetical protein